MGGGGGGFSLVTTKVRHSANIMLEISTVMKYIEKIFSSQIWEKSFSETNPLPAKAAIIWGHFDAAMKDTVLASSALNIFFAYKYETDFAKTTEWQI